MRSFWGHDPCRHVLAEAPKLNKNVTTTCVLDCPYFTAPLTPFLLPCAVPSRSAG